MYIFPDEYVLAARTLMAPQYRSLSDQDIRNILYQHVSSLPAEDAEGFLDGLSSIAKSVGQVALKAVPTVAPILGTVVGGAFGGPLGAQLGSTLGQTAGQFVSGVASGQSAGTALKSAAGTGIQGLVGTFTGAGSPLGKSPIGNIVGALGSTAASALQGGGKKSAASLLSNFISNPQVTNSIGSLLMGSLGQKSTPVTAGGQTFNFNPAQILGALGTLANQAAIEAAEDAEDTGYAYLLNPDGTYAVDPNNPEQRAHRIYQLMQQQARESRQWFYSPTAVGPEPDRPPVKVQKTITEWFEEAGLMEN